jgi:hypothetical protein
VSSRHGLPLLGSMRGYRLKMRKGMTGGRSRDGPKGLGGSLRGLAQRRPLLAHVALAVQGEVRGKPGRATADAFVIERA